MWSRWNASGVRANIWKTEAFFSLFPTQLLATLLKIWWVISKIKNKKFRYKWSCNIQWGCPTFYNIWHGTSWVHIWVIICMIHPGLILALLMGWVIGLEVKCSCVLNDHFWAWANENTGANAEKPHLPTTNQMRQCKPNSIMWGAPAKFGDSHKLVWDANFAWSLLWFGVT